MTSRDVAADRAAHNETVIEGQKRALELAVHGAPLAQILDALVRTIEAQSTNNVLGSILLLDDDRKHLLLGAAPSLPGAYNDAIHGIEIGPTVGSCGTAAFTAKTVVVEDIENDPLWANFKALALSHELRACWSTPITSSKGEVLGTFALYHRVPMVPTQRDREIVELLGHTAAVVIERDRNERARQEMDAKLRATMEEQIRRIGILFEHAPASIAVVRGPSHVFELANPGYINLVGGRPVLGKPLLDALPELRDQGFDKLLEGVKSTGQPHIGRATRVPLTDGEIFVDFVYQPVPEPDGTIDSVLAVAFDVTELVKARARAEASERALRDFVDNLPALAWTARPDGYVDHYNNRWFEYTGTTAEEMEGTGWEAVMDPEYLPQVRERWSQSLATGTPFEMEFPMRAADGSSQWFLTRVAPMKDENGTILRWFGTNTNIDDIRAARALSDAMAQQSLDVQEALLKLRREKEMAERRLAELVGSRAR